MPGSWPESSFPNLNTDTCKITSAATKKYNCLAWAAKETHRWWWPDGQGIYYWPRGIPRQTTMEAFVLAYATLGFRVCFSNALESSLEKLALYGHERGGTVVPTHAALQLENGAWTSKLGICEDIEHTTADAVGGPAYGRPLIYLQRVRASGNF